MAKKSIPTLSLFSGAGGLDLGFIQAGFDIKACVEIEPSYCATLGKNLNGGDGYKAGTVVHCEDIRRFDARRYKDLGIRCVIGGPPCQTFSAAGRRSGGVIGLEDDRGQLFQAYCRVLDVLRPDVFVFENVYGLPGANGGEPWREITKAFSERGYRLHAEVVDAADYGVPQHRERLILVGCRKGDFTFPMPTHGPDSSSDIPLVSVENAIRDLQNPREPYHNNLGGMYGHLLALVPEGLNYSYFTAEMGHPEPVFAWRSKFHDLLYKVNRKEPCRTLKAQPGKFTGPFHWKNRHFTVPELKRLQTFPDGYEIAGSYAKVIEQIGNSVPPRLAYVIATSVREQLLEKTNRLTFKERQPGFKSTFRQRQRVRSKRFDEIAARALPKQYKATAAKVSHTNKPAETYYLNPRNIFDRTRYTSQSAIKMELPRFCVETTETDSKIEMNFERIGAGSKVGRSEVVIAGLRKYLPGFESLTLSARVSEVEDIFHAWAAIEDALTRRSQFFTLIDIYGHYANRGDVVDVKGKWLLSKRSDLLRAINYFTATGKCGGFIQESALLRDLDVDTSKLATLVSAMRAVRFDIRTAKSHPIIGKHRVLCTYPFPLLSPRALVESKAMLRGTIEPETNSSLLEAV